MPEIPTSTNPVHSLLEDGMIEEPLRPYLGYSLIGSECARYIWYSFRWAYKKFITPREKRLFERGDQEEIVIVRDLERAGIRTRNTLASQIEVTGLMGHGKGHPDGSCINVPGAENIEHSLEMKTSADKYFNQFFRWGVRRTSPKYFTQTQCYMGKTNLKRSLFIVTNKNNDARHYERIHFEPDVAEKAEEKGFDIITSIAPPQKISPLEEYYICRMCDAKEVCFQRKAPERNCRTCANVRVRNDGQWGCGMYPSNSKPIPVEFQRTGCPDGYKPLI